MEFNTLMKQLAKEDAERRAFSDRERKEELEKEHARLSKLIREAYIKQYKYFDTGPLSGKAIDALKKEGFVLKERTSCNPSTHDDMFVGWMVCLPK